MYDVSADVTAYVFHSSCQIHRGLSYVANCYDHTNNISRGWGGLGDLGHISSKYPGIGIETYYCFATFVFNYFNETVLYTF